MGPGYSGRQQQSRGSSSGSHSLNPSWLPNKYMSVLDMINKYSYVHPIRQNNREHRNNNNNDNNNKNEFLPGKRNSNKCNYWCNYCNISSSHISITFLSVSVFSISKGEGLGEVRGREEVLKEK